MEAACRQAGSERSLWSDVLLVAQIIRPGSTPDLLSNGSPGSAGSGRMAATGITERTRPEPDGGAVVGRLSVEVPRDKIAEFCQKWKIREFSLFGSVLRDDFRPDSDIDVIVDFEVGVSYGLLDMASMAADLEKVFGREVDLLTRRAVEQSRNYIRRRGILSSMEPVYVA